jgi:hypothetical protein
VYRYELVELRVKCETEFRLVQVFSEEFRALYDQAFEPFRFYSGFDEEQYWKTKLELHESLAWDLVSLGFSQMECGGEVPDRQLAATRQLFQGLIDRLLAIVNNASQEGVIKQFELCVEGLNSLDAEEQFICTIEREDLCEELYKIGGLCGMPDGDWVDDWRDW